MGNDVTMDRLRSRHAELASQREALHGEPKPPRPLPPPREGTLSSKIVKAAIRMRTLGITAFTIEDLAIRCWDLWPEAFGLAGYEGRYPDTHKVRYCLFGQRGLIARGYIVPTEADDGKLQLP